jgi:hypothetical protein
MASVFGGTSGNERGRLKTERLAAAGGQDDDAVAAVEDGLNRLALKRPKAGVAPDAMEHVQIHAFLAYLAST